MLDDQQRINKFARLNSRLEEFKDDIKNKKNEIQTLEDAATDIMMMEDDEETVSKAGKSFALIDWSPVFENKPYFHINVRLKKMMLFE